MLKRLGCRFNQKTRSYEPPSEPAIRRFLKKVDSEAVDQAINGWLRTLAGKEAAVAVDGKTLRGARQEFGRQVHLLTAFLHQNGMVLAQRQIDSKTNEIPNLQPLLQPVELKGCVVTLDFLHTQKETDHCLVEEKGADYLMTVKDNQSNLKKDIEELHLVAFPPQHQTIDKAHGPLEICQIWTSTELNNYLKFPYIGQVFAIQRDFTIFLIPSSFVLPVPSTLNMSSRHFLVPSNLCLLRL